MYYLWEMYFFQAAVQRRPGDGSGPQEDRCIPPKRGELQAGGGGAKDGAVQPEHFEQAQLEAVVHSRSKHFGCRKSIN